MIPSFDSIARHHKAIGLLAIIVCIAAWASEFAGMVYICPYCRVQRSVIGILGILLLLPWVAHWLSQYISLVVGFFGLVVAANQHFMGWKKISSNTFSFNENLLIDPFILSGLALFAIMGLLGVIVKKPNCE